VQQKLHNITRNSVSVIHTSEILLLLGRSNGILVEMDLDLANFVFRF